MEKINATIFANRTIRYLKLLSILLFATFPIACKQTQLSKSVKNTKYIVNNFNISNLLANSQWCFYHDQNNFAFDSQDVNNLGTAIGTASMQDIIANKCKYTNNWLWTNNNNIDFTPISSNIISDNTTLLATNMKFIADNNLVGGQIQIEYLPNVHFDFAYLLYNGQYHQLENTTDILALSPNGQYAVGVNITTIQRLNTAFIINTPNWQLIPVKLYYNEDAIVNNSNIDIQLLKSVNNYGIATGVVYTKDNELYITNCNLINGLCDIIGQIPDEITQNILMVDSILTDSDHIYINLLQQSDGNDDYYSYMLNYNLKKHEFSRILLDYQALIGTQFIITSHNITQNGLLVINKMADNKTIGSFIYNTRTNKIQNANNVINDLLTSDQDHSTNFYYYNSDIHISNNEQYLTLIANVNPDNQLMKKIYLFGNSNKLL
jgi:hypothetical protein